MSAEKFTKVSSLTVADFLAKTNQDKPEITGGCVLLTTATLTTSMVLMGLKISLKNTSDPDQKRLLKRKITTIYSCQQKIEKAADHDLEVFDFYRKLLKSKSRFRAVRLEQALKKATDSLLDVCNVLYQAIIVTDESLSYVHSTVRSDLEAGKLILEAVYKGILALAEGNIQGMPAEAQQKYSKRKATEEGRIED